MEALLLSARENGTTSIPVLYDHLQKLVDESEIITAKFNEDSEAAWWADALANQIRDAYNDVNESSPWLSLPEAPQRFVQLTENLSHNISLEELASLEVSILPIVHAFDEEDLTGGRKILA